ncbi:MAG: DUF2510 domain-containing protein [Actinomycetota bacterium]
MLNGRRPARPPGWHADPTGRHQFREWDGARWTEHVSDRGRVGVDPIRPVRADRRSRTRAARRRMYVPH